MDNAYERLLNAVESLGYPREFGVVMAGELRSDQAMGRMATYLRRARPQTPEEIADELLAIVEERERWVRQKISEHANASLTAFYNRPDR